MLFRARCLMTGTRGVQVVILAVACALTVGQGCPTVPSGGGGGGTEEFSRPFVGSDECYICHSRHHDNWAQTRHARAYQTLQEVGQAENPLCLNCHTTGYGQDGFESIASTPELAGVGCEACHGAAREHRMNVSETDLRPPTSIAATVCGKCHNFHHPTFDEWSSSRHASVTEDVAHYFEQGRNLAACGVCHSGDYRKAAFIDDDQATVPETLLVGVAQEDMHAATCAVCHDPHRNTGNAVNAPPGHDFQLRYPEVTSPSPSNTVAATTDASRFNGCGQCHHDRGRTWVSTSRGPHPSVQANFYLGEMPMPEGEAPLVPNTRTAHRFVFKQCVTCHMQHEIPLPETGEVGQTHAGHRFAVESFAGCSTAGCHASPGDAQAEMAALQSSVRARLDAIAARLGPESTWQYSAEGGPPESQQADIPAEIKKVRFLYEYVHADASFGVHNPEYTRAILTEAERLLTSIGR